MNLNPESYLFTSPVLGLQAQPTATGLMIQLFFILSLSGFSLENRLKYQEVREWLGGEEKKAPISPGT